MDTRFARLNIQLSQAPADIDAFNKIHRCIVEAALYSYGCEDEFEVAYHNANQMFSVTVTYECESELDIITAGWLLGGTQACFEQSGVASASFWLSTHDAQDKTIESVL